MKITPLDIKKQDFKKVMRGYEPIEVETFLEMVSEEFEDLIKEKNFLADEVLKFKTQLKDYQEVEKTFKESLMSAQQTINQSRENSQKEANLIIREAEIEAEKILEDTKINLIEMKNELMLIKSQKDSFAKRLKHLLESQLELIGVLELDDLGLGKFLDDDKENFKKKMKIKPANQNSIKKKNNNFDIRENSIIKDKKDEKNLSQNDDDKFSDQFII